jgi:hypothetical protein
VCVDCGSLKKALRFREGGSRRPSVGSTVDAQFIVPACIDMTRPGSDAPEATTADTTAAGTQPHARTTVRSKRPLSASEDSVLLAFPHAALRMLHLPDNELPPTFAALDNHVEALLRLPIAAQVREATTTVRAYMHVREESFMPDVNTDEAVFKEMEAEKRLLTCALGGVKPQDSVRRAALAKQLHAAKAQHEAAKAKLIASLSQSVVALARQLLEESGATVGCASAVADGPGASKLARCGRPITPPTHPPSAAAEASAVEAASVMAEQLARDAAASPC